MTFWSRPVPVRRNDYIKSSDFSEFVPFQPSYEKNCEKEQMWKLMRMDYQKIWEKEKKVLMDEYLFYVREKNARLYRKYVPKIKFARERENNTQKKADRYIYPKFAKINATVDSQIRKTKSNLSSPANNDVAIEVGTAGKEKHIEKKTKIKIDKKNVENINEDERPCKCTYELQ